MDEPIATLEDLEREGTTVLVQCRVPSETAPDGVTPPPFVQEMRVPMSVLREWLKR